MQTDISPNQHVFIQRHCMQQLLHEAINNNQKQCCGWLTGNGNIITNNIHVTDKLFSSNIFTPSLFQKEGILGTYFATDKRGNITQNSIMEMNLAMANNGLPQQQHFLVLYLDHNGRIDALMFADPALQNPVTLIMKEG